MIKIPSEIKKIMNTDDLLSNELYDILSCKFCKIIEETGMPFFPEYTEHGIIHFQNIVDLSINLIPKKELKNLKRDEISAFFLAVLLHDIIMHITFEGFCTLLNSDLKHPIINETWGNLWSIYIHEINNENDKIENIFGTTNLEFSLPSENIKMTYLKNMICGEFIRRNHGALAYSILNYGFPGIDGTFIKNDCKIRQELIEIAAIIAMSHCYQLREMEVFLKKHYGEFRESLPLGIRIYYLMGLLRLADYLDAGQERAQKLITDLKRIYSKISKGEWKWNNDINSSNYSWNHYSSVLDIYANPQDAESYYKIKNWIIDMQKELDYTWAINYEKYSNDTLLEYSIRKISSPVIDNVEIFKCKYNTEPVNMNFDLYSIQELLSSELYGNNCNYAIRELIQNAIDACIVRTYIDNDYSPLINVYLNDESFIIEDNGIGMDMNDIINIFLYKGRKNKDKLIINENKILQNGHFGIGFLSAFMLTNDITITTRKAGEQLGYKFHLSKELKPLEINSIECNIGTKISMPLKRNAFEMKLGYIWESIDSDYKLVYLYYMDYYLLDKPEIKYYYNGEYIERNRYYDSEDDDFFGYPDFSQFTKINLDAWLFFKDIGDGIYLRFETNPIFLLNGFLYKFENQQHNTSIAIFDKENSISFDLARNKITSFPFAKKINKRIIDLIITSLICNTTLDKDTLTLKHLNLSKNYYSTIYYENILLFKNGFKIIYENSLQDLIEPLYYFVVSKSCSFIIDKILKKENIACIVSLYNKDMLFCSGYNSQIYIPEGTEFNYPYGITRLTYITPNFEHPDLDFSALNEYRDSLKMIIEISDVKRFIDARIKRGKKRDHSDRKIFVDDFIKEPCPLIPYDDDKRREQFPKYFSLYNEFIQNVLKICFIPNSTFLLPIL